jgi:uncharacterized protein YacL
MIEYILSAVAFLIASEIIYWLLLDGASDFTDSIFDLIVAKIGAAVIFAGLCIGLVVIYMLISELWELGFAKILDIIINALRYVFEFLTKDYTLLIIIAVIIFFYLNIIWGRKIIGRRK